MPFHYDIFGVPYAGHIKPEHYNFLHELPHDAINAALEEAGARVMRQMNSIEAEYERIEHDKTAT